MIQPKPYSEACDQNKQPILDVLLDIFINASSVLEIGSGTGQHAVFFANALPHLFWQTSDQQENHTGINAWLQQARLTNTGKPIDLNVSNAWPKKTYNGIFSANTTHIMGWTEVKQLFAGVASVLIEGGYFVLYGPFNYAGKYTSQSNQQFDQWLKQRDIKSGIRNFEDVDVLASNSGLVLRQDVAMPANNRILLWQKKNNKNDHCRLG